MEASSQSARLHHQSHQNTTNKQNALICVYVLDGPWPSNKLQVLMKGFLLLGFIL